MPSSADIATASLSSARLGSRTRVIAYAGMLLVCATVLGLVETWLLVASPLPWLRLGLANVAIVIALAWFGPRVALTVSVLRVVLVGIATGSLLGPGMLVSTAGAVVALGVMALLWAAGDRFSIIGWSIAGAFSHVIAQFAMAALLAGSSAILLMAPVSLLASLPLGAATGLIARLLISRVMTPA